MVYPRRASTLTTPPVVQSRPPYFYGSRCIAHPFPWQVLHHSQLRLQVKSLEMDVLVALAMLRRRINSHESPVYRLHSELLSLIASRLAKDDLIKATHISYHWREVLLAHPSLWSTIEFSQYQSASEQAATFFSRSKSATIHVSLPRRVQQLSSSY